MFLQKEKDQFLKKILFNNNYKTKNMKKTMNNFKI